MRVRVPSAARSLRAGACKHQHSASARTPPAASRAPATTPAGAPDAAGSRTGDLAGFGLADRSRARPGTDPAPAPPVSALRRRRPL
jgi:hypothetical protein